MPQLQKDSPEPRLYTPAFVWALLSSATFGYGFSTFFLLPVYLEREYQAGPDTIGLIGGIVGAGVVLGAPLAHVMAKRVASHQMVIVAALLGAAAHLVYVIEPAPGLVMVALRMLQGVSFALFVGGHGAVVASTTPRARMSEALGLAGASMLVTNALAPSVAEFLVEVAGWKPVFGLAAGFSFVSAIAMQRGPKLRIEAVAEGPSFVRLCRRPGIGLATLIMAGGGAVFGIMFNLGPPLLLEFGVERTAPFFAAFAIAAMGVRVLAGSVPDRWGHYRVAVLMLTLFSSAPVLLLAGGDTFVVGAGAIFGLGHGLLFPALFALVLAASELELRSSVLAALNAGFFAGSMVGSAFLGEMAALHGLGFAFWGASAIGFLALGLLLLSPRFSVDGFRAL